MIKLHIKTDFLAGLFVQKQKVEFDQNGIATFADDSKAFCPWESIDSPLLLSSAFGVDFYRLRRMIMSYLFRY